MHRLIATRLEQGFRGVAGVGHERWRASRGGEFFDRVNERARDASAGDGWMDIKLVDQATILKAIKPTGPPPISATRVKPFSTLCANASSSSAAEAQARR